MNVKKFFIINVCLLFTSMLFASEQKVILFFESAQDIPNKVINQINSSDKLCISAIIKSNNQVSQSINNLIIINKIEPTMSIEEEPYFPLISKQIKITDDLIFNETDILDSILSTYKNDISLFEKRKNGLNTYNNFIDDDFLQIIYKKNISWVTTKTRNDLNITSFMKHNIVVFVPYTNLPNSTANIANWFDTIQEEFIPIFIPSSKIKNEKYISYLLKFIDTNKNLDVYLPINAAYEIAKKNSKQDINLIQYNIPNEFLIKLAIADEEVKNNKKNEQLHTVTSDELKNMYSLHTTDNILKENNISIQLFNISYGNIFRISNKEIPDISKILKETKTFEQNGNIDKLVFDKKQNGYTISNDNIIKTFSISKTSDSINFYVNYNQELVDDICIYIDMNNLNNIGNQALLKREGFFVNENCWEYAIYIKSNTLKIYKYVNNSNSLVKEFELNSSSNFSIPLNIFRGNPFNWNYQIVATKDNNVIDFIETDVIRKGTILNKESVVLRMISCDNN